MSRRRFTQAAMKEAVIEQLEDGTFFAEIPPCSGVWADGKDEKECLAILQEVLEEWLLFKLRDGDNDIPVLGGADLNHKWQEKL
ncbi:type II toxin-antitoxin system HicB family antitoxin [Neomoorella thermoacetica]|uniref:type II toxin-antitoxin system HicB family antitoxin n=1 Tax=Neomoorella thermoacetica TaxID=1525 RepID=UPI0009BD7607